MVQRCYPAFEISCANILSRLVGNLGMLRISALFGIELVLDSNLYQNCKCVGDKLLLKFLFMDASPGTLKSCLESLDIRGLLWKRARASD